MKSIVPVRGFSLVEIVVALGIISFSLMAVLGLISVGLNSGRKALDENLIAVMSREVVGSLRQQYFANNELLTSVTETDPASAPVLKTVYFNANGVLVNSTDTGFDQPLYKCVVKAVKRDDILGPEPKVGGTVPNLLELNLAFNWPVMNGRAANSYNVRTSIARYY